MCVRVQVHVSVGERMLDTSANNFERGKLDTFMFTVRALMCMQVLLQSEC